jgi:predicted acetyltransferase
MLSLEKPDTTYKAEYIDMIEYWRSTGEELAPWTLNVDYSDFGAMVKKFEGYSKGINVGEDFVPSSTYWIYESDSGRIVGAVNIRHRLNDSLLAYWGHIGYGVRPDERRKGYATQALHLALERCRELGIESALVSCNKDNIGSAKTIMNNGGVLENEVECEGRVLQRYWIKTK